MKANVLPVVHVTKKDNTVSVNRIPTKASKITRGHSVDRIPEYFGPPGGPILFYS
ncbi:acinetodin/klebsidin/J25 family lasso peptide [Citrobacter sp. CtB7.12]|uniref:acinetodin/klebsidin/J25 family lasso peptide n=1 Tax=Citrobacter sp. CtB7.12 TaxID=1696093 RepID=UPI000B13A082|nr:acinetodin/klebsidin/J25 family lasso peptide [Citrobacter sp. CtB7.12]